MTTESTQVPRSRVATPLLGAAAATCGAGVVLVALGAALGGSEAALGALVGAALALVVFGAGSAVVHAVAGLMPSAALLVALMTYTLQVLGMALAFVVLTESGRLDHDIDRSWLAGAVITGTLVWLVAQVVATTRLRIPAFEGTATTQVDAPDNQLDRAPQAGAR